MTHSSNLSLSFLALFSYKMRLNSWAVWESMHQWQINKPVENLGGKRARELMQAVLLFQSMISSLLHTSHPPESGPVLQTVRDGVFPKSRTAVLLFPWYYKTSDYPTWTFLAAVSACCFLSCPAKIWHPFFLFLFAIYPLDIRHHSHPQGCLLHSDTATSWVFPWRLCCKDSDPSFSSLDFLKTFRNYFKVEKVFQTVLQATSLFIHLHVLFFSISKHCL